LTLEVEYCQGCLNSYSAWLDLWILWYTFLIALRLCRPMTIDEVRELMRKHCPSLNSKILTPRAYESLKVGSPKRSEKEVALPRA
jgi:hypothetical protein